MDSFDNPQQFENSSIVQKSSKTGIFSNKRLLVIKNGYLYYFSKVPKGYKSHVPNILSTFTDLPKSSIEIKNILQIRLQSTKSSNLIIKFYMRDMIDREDIRKSIDSHSYMIPQKKINQQIDEWKFMFTTVLQCRLWFNALIKLKDYFKNLDNKFKDFVSNFDPKRGSVNDVKDFRSQSDLKILVESNMSSQANKFSEQTRKTEPIKFDALKFIGSVPQKQPSPKSPKLQHSPKSQSLKSKNQQLKVQKINESYVIQEEQQTSQNGYHPNISHQIQPQIPKLSSQNLTKGESFVSSLKQSHLIQPINEEDQFKIRQFEEDIREQVKQQVQKQIRQEVQSKIKDKIQRQNKDQINKFKAQVQFKQIKIKQLQTEIHIKHLANMEKQKLIEAEKKQLQDKISQQQEKLKQYKIKVEAQIQQQKKLKHNQKKSSNLKPNKDKPQPEIFLKNVESIDLNNQRKWLQVGDQYELSQNTYNHYQNQNHIQTKISIINNQSIQVHQFSVQTDDEQSAINPSDSYESQFNFPKKIILSKQLNISKQTKGEKSLILDHLASNKNKLFSQRVKIQKNIMSSDQNYQKEQFLKFNYFYQFSRIFENGISSNQKIQREIKLMRYANFAKRQMVYIAQQYIDRNHPNQSETFEKQIFSFELVCARGKIMNIGGQNKLIYSNKAHQNLKRTFKVYQSIQNQIQKIMKNKSAFPVRVPLCVLIQYKGYTILGKIQVCSNQIDFVNKDKYLKYILPKEAQSSVKLSKAIQTKENDEFYIIKVLKPFKITNLQKRSEIFKFKDNFLLCQTHILRSRKFGVSICYQKLKKEFEQKKEQFNEINEDDNERKQDNQNQIWVLKLFKLMREIKKIFKSMEPYNQLSSPQNKTSQFVEILVTKPMQLLALIPSDIDFKDFQIQCGYFWSLLEFFLGIRINNPIKKNLQIPTYQFVPVVRTYHFQSFISNQYCEKIDRYLSLKNIQSQQNCLRLFKRISGQDIQELLMQIKILLKRNQYSQAQGKIYFLRELLPLHDLKNIEINAYLIQCYVFMGMETDALKEIKLSLQYVEYMFRNRQNVFEQNLHLLMAETLLKIGNIQESIKIYKSLLKHDKIGKESILISFGENLISDSRFDLNQAIPLLIQGVEQIRNTDQKIQLLSCIARLYLRLQRKDKCIFYLQKAYEISLASQCYQNILKIYQMLMEQSKQEQNKYRSYQKLIQKVENKFFDNQQNCKYFNTINLYHHVNSHQKEEKNKIIYLLQQILANLNHNEMFSIQLKDWESLRLFGNVLSNQQEFQNEEELESVCKTLQSVDVERLLIQLKKTHNQH